MEEIEQSNKVKILSVIKNNARASLSELAEKTGLTRQTVAKTINNMEKNNEIWGYTTIFDPKLVGKKLFVILLKVDYSNLLEDNFKRVFDLIEKRRIVDKYDIGATLHLNGRSDVLISLWAKDLIEAKKFMNQFKNYFPKNILDIELFDIIAVYRNNGISNPKVMDELKNILF